MSYGALVLQVLISSPSDLPQHHRDLIHRCLRGWNATHGKYYGIHFSPVDGNESVAPAFGDYAQAVVNDQIVSESDMCVAVFTDRLGSPTPGGHPSGTAEEVAEMHTAGKEVGVLRNLLDRSPATGEVAARQILDLETYLEDQRSKAFVSEYRSEADLVSVFERLLSRMARKYRSEVDSTEDRPSASRGASSDEADESSGIWPHVEVSESVNSDSKGRIKTRRHKKLVLQSDLDYPACNVRYRYEDVNGQADELFSLRTEEGVLAEVLPPRGAVTSPILQALGSPSSAMCVVTWEDKSGAERSTRATVRA